MQLKHVIFTVILSTKIEGYILVFFVLFFFLEGGGGGDDVDLGRKYIRVEKVYT